ncbi:hypothetical protein ACOMHN_019331 [Nucella lapillus]
MSNSGASEPLEKNKRVKPIHNASKACVGVVSGQKNSNIFTAKGMTIIGRWLCLAGGCYLAGGLMGDTTTI